MYRLVSILFLFFAQMTLLASNAAANKLPPPNGLVATSSNKIDGAIELRWSAVKGAASYTIAASREAEDNWQVLDVVIGTEFQVNELPEATKYYFRIASNTKLGQGDWSTSVMQYSSGKKRRHSAITPSQPNPTSTILTMRMQSAVTARNAAKTRTFATKNIPAYDTAQKTALAALQARHTTVMAQRI